MRKILLVLAVALIGLTAAANAQTISTASISANGGVASVSMSGVDAAGAAITNTWVGTITFYEAPSRACVSTERKAILGYRQSTGTLVATATANDLYSFPNTSYRYVCLVATAWTSGTAAIAFVEGYLPPPAQGVGGSGTSDATAANQTTQIAHEAAIETATEALQAQAAADAAEDVADGASNVGKKPVLIGCNALALGSDPTGVDAADRKWCISTTDGQIFVVNGHPNSVTKTAVVTDAAGAQTGTAIVSVSAGSRIVLTAWGVNCSNANTVNPDFRLAFDTDGTFAADSTAGVVGHIAAFDDIPPGGGDGKTGLFVIGADDEDLRYSLGDPVTGSCTVSVSYFTIQS